MFKLLFEFDVVDDWPPVGRELLWVDRVEGNQYRVDNIPFFACGIACGDVIEAEPKTDEPALLRLRGGGDSSLRPFHDSDHRGHEIDAGGPRAVSGRRLRVGVEPLAPAVRC